MESLERETNAQIHALTNQFSQQVFKSVNPIYLLKDPLLFLVHGFYPVGLS